MGEHDLLVLDVDRTLLRSGEFSTIVASSLADILKLHDDQAMYLIERAAESKGKLFDYLTWAAAEFNVTLPTANQLVARILEHNTFELERRVIIPGTIEIVRVVKACGAQALLMTAGSILLQQVKIQVLQALIAVHGLGGTVDDYMITAPHHIKASLLIDAFDAGRFKIERLTRGVLAYDIDTADKYAAITDVFLVDDKAKYLESDDERFHGILVTSDGAPVRPDSPAINLVDVAKIVKS